MFLRRFAFFLLFRTIGPSHFQKAYNPQHRIILRRKTTLLQGLLKLDLPEKIRKYNNYSNILKRILWNVHIFVQKQLVSNELCKDCMIFQSRSFSAKYGSSKKIATHLSISFERQLQKGKVICTPKKYLWGVDLRFLQLCNSVES